MTLIRATPAATDAKPANPGAPAPVYPIEIVLVAIGPKGPLYDARHAGETIVRRSRQPLLDAARVFHAAGVIGTLEMWHVGAANAAMRGDIDRCAELTVAENEHHGPRFARYEPMPSAGIAFAGAASDQGREF